MRVTIIATIRPLTLLLVLFLVLSGCALTDSSEGKWQLGDSKTREADNMLMLFVPGGEFSMGIDHIGMRYALDLCRQVKGTVGAGVCQGTSFANEMPTHPVSLSPRTMSPPMRRVLPEMSGMSRTSPTVVMPAV